MPVYEAQVESFIATKRDGKLEREKMRYRGLIERLQPCTREDLLRAEVPDSAVFVGPDGSKRATARNQQMMRSVHDLIEDGDVWIIGRVPGAAGKPIDLLALASWAQANGYKKLTPRKSARDDAKEARESEDAAWLYVETLLAIIGERGLPTSEFKQEVEDRLAGKGAIDSLQAA